MPLKKYSLLVGKAKGFKLDDKNDPHIEILIESEHVLYRIAVNVRSKNHPNDLLYLKCENLETELTKRLSDIDEGVIDIKKDRPDLAIDYVKDDRFERVQMQIAPYDINGPDNDLKDFILPLVNEAILDDAIKIYAFGEMWGPENKKDTYFGFTPGRGIHDIHMNQGNSGQFEKYNGDDQDGALFFKYPDGTFTAIYLAFQGQWRTQSKEKRGSIAIVAAVINAKNPEKGKESVTLFNRSDGDVSINNWKIRDQENRVFVIKNREIKAGEAVKIVLSGEDARFTNSGGSITLLDGEETIVSTAEYGKSNEPEGWSKLFL